MLDKHAINKLHDYTKFLSVLGLVAFVFLTAVIELDVTPKPSPTRRCVCVCVSVLTMHSSFRQQRSPEADVGFQ